MKPRKPTVAVGMPVYNGERWLREAIESILGQSFGDLELIISDNASTDSTADICLEYSKRDARVRYARNSRNLGVTNNYNAVFQRSAAPFFKWASSNDVCESTMIEKCVRALEGRPDAVLSCPKTVLISRDGRPMVYCEDRIGFGATDPIHRFKTFLANVTRNNVFNGLIRSKALARTRLLGKFIGSDINLMAELTLHGPFLQVPEYLFYRRIGAAASTESLTEIELLRNYDPDATRVMTLQEWKGSLALFGSAWRAPLEVGLKAKLFFHLLRRLVWVRQVLARDLWESLVKAKRARPDRDS